MSLQLALSKNLENAVALLGINMRVGGEMERREE